MREKNGVDRASAVIPYTRSEAIVVPLFVVSILNPINSTMIAVRVTNRDTPAL